MSASGTGLFDDDMACETRAPYRTYLQEGKTPAEATRAVLRDCKPALADEEDGPVIWLALAAIQCQYGCLESRVKARVLAAIDNGSDLEHWRATGDPTLVRSRMAVLARLRAKLAAPPPARARLPAKAKKRREPVDEKAIWPLGEVFAYRLGSGQFILMHVTDFMGTDRPGAAWWAPIVGLLDWQGKSIPPAEHIASLPYQQYLIEKNVPSRNPGAFLFCLARRRESEMPADRVIRKVGRRRARKMENLLGLAGGCRCSCWRQLDHDLEEWLDWK